MKSTTIYHPKTNLLSRTIQQDVDSGLWYSDERGDFWDTKDEAIEDAREDMDYHYSGQWAKDTSESARYARAERFACGNY